MMHGDTFFFEHLIVQPQIRMAESAQTRRQQLRGQAKRKAMLTSITSEGSTWDRVPKAIYEDIMKHNMNWGENNNRSYSSDPNGKGKQEYRNVVNLVAFVLSDDANWQGKQNLSKTDVNRIVLDKLAEYGLERKYFTSNAWRPFMSKVARIIDSVEVNFAQKKVAAGQNFLSYLEARDLAEMYAQSRSGSEETEVSIAAQAVDPKKQSRLAELFGRFGDKGKSTGAAVDKGDVVPHRMSLGTPLNLPTPLPLSRSRSPSPPVTPIPIDPRVAGEKEKQSKEALLEFHKKKANEQLDHMSAHWRTLRTMVFAKGVLNSRRHQMTNYNLWKKSYQELRDVRDQAESNGFSLGDLLTPEQIDWFRDMIHEERHKVLENEKARTWAPAFGKLRKSARLRQQVKLDPPKQYNNPDAIRVDLTTRYYMVLQPPNDIVFMDAKQKGPHIMKTIAKDKYLVLESRDLPDTFEEFRADNRGFLTSLFNNMTSIANKSKLERLMYDCLRFMKQGNVAEVQDIVAYGIEVDQHKPEDLVLDKQIRARTERAKQECRDASGVTREFLLRYLANVKEVRKITPTWQHFMQDDPGRRTPPPLGDEEEKVMPAPVRLFSPVAPSVVPSDAAVINVPLPRRNLGRVLFGQLRQLGIPQAQQDEWMMERLSRYSVSMSSDTKYAPVSYNTFPYRDSKVAYDDKNTGEQFQGFVRSAYRRDPLAKMVGKRSSIGNHVSILATPQRYHILVYKDVPPRALKNLCVQIKKHLRSLSPMANVELFREVGHEYKLVLSADRLRQIGLARLARVLIEYVGKKKKGHHVHFVLLQTIPGGSLHSYRGIM